MIRLFLVGACALVIDVSAAMSPAPLLDREHDRRLP